MRTDGWTVRRLALVAGSLLAVYPSNRLAAQCPDGSPPPCARPAAGAVSAPTSLAVLYFDNLSRDSADAYLVDGLTEEITDRLGDIERLQVKSRTSVRRLQATTPGDLPALAHALRVRYVVEGSVRRTGPRVRVSVRLVRAADGFRVWGESYDRSLNDLLALQADVAHEVASSIAGRLLPDERAVLRKRVTRNGAAYERFLRGNYALARRTSRAIAVAIDEYEAAARLDPRFGAAYARMAYGYALLCYYGTPDFPFEDLLARGEAAADRALALDSTTGDAWMAAGLLRSFRHPQTFAGVREAFERAIALDPRNAEAYHQFGAKLMELREDSAAAAAYRRALALEPERPISLVGLAEIAFVARRLGEAIRWDDSALVVDSTFAIARGQRAVARWLAGDTVGARADASWLKASHFLALLDLRAGDTTARSRLDSLLRPRLEETGLLTVNDIYDLSVVLVGSGQHDQALEVLERARPRGLVLAFYMQMPWWDPVRNEPVFQRVFAEARPQ